MGRFFIGWGAWQQLCFILGVAMVVALCLAGIMRCLADRKVRQASTLAARARLERALRRRGGVWTGNGGIPFGIAALETDVPVDGIEQSLPGTPATGTSVASTEPAPMSLPQTGARNRISWGTRIWGCCGGWAWPRKSEEHGAGDAARLTGPNEDDLEAGELGFFGNLVEDNHDGLIDPERDPIARALDDPYASAMRSLLATAGGSEFSNPSVTYGSTSYISSVSSRMRPESVSGVPMTPENWKPSNGYKSDQTDQSDQSNEDPVIEAMQKQHRSQAAETGQLFRRRDLAATSESSTGMVPSLRLPSIDKANTATVAEPVANETTNPVAAMARPALQVAGASDGPILSLPGPETLSASTAVGQDVEVSVARSPLMRSDVNRMIQGNGPTYQLGQRPGIQSAGSPRMQEENNAATNGSGKQPGAGAGKLTKQPKAKAKSRLQAFKERKRSPLGM